VRPAEAQRADAILLARAAWCPGQPERRPAGRIFRREGRMPTHDQRIAALHAEANRIERALVGALPDGVSYAAIILALGNLVQRWSVHWAQATAKCWKRP